MVRVTDMTHGRPIRLILLFSLPLMLGSVFQQLYTIVDTIIIGRGVGMQALASIGAADWINWLVLWGLQGFTQGFAILAAQEFGAGAYDRLRRVLAMIVKLSCWFGIAVTIISLLLVRPLLTLLHTDPAVFGGAQTYLYVQFGGSLIIIAYNMAAAVLRCLGDSRTPLLAILAASFANIALDLLFVMGFGWGIFGASFATVLAQLIAFLLCLRSLRRLPFVQLTKADWKTDPAILLHLCRLGIPTGLQMSMITLGGMVLQSVLNGFGVVFVAGYTAANKLYGILESASVAFGYAMTAYMGQNRGARNAARIDAGIRAVLALSAGFTAAIVTAMLLAGKPLLGLFLSTEEAGAADALAVAYQYLMVLMAFLLALFVLQAYRSSLQGLGEMTVPTLSGFAEMLMRMGAALVLPTFIGQSGVFFAEGAAWVCAAALNLVWYYMRIGKIKRDMLK
ncbi:MATE family efflux transporter [Agathobaculum butyriciproducens]